MPLEISKFACDGVRPGDITEQWRFPIITTAYPGWNYVSAVVVSNLDWSIRPSDDELAIVASWHEEYCSYWYGPAHTGYRYTMESKFPFDIDGGANGRWLAKYKNGGWGYRHRSWQYGPTFVPSFNAEPPMSLIAVLDREQAYGLKKPNPRWEKWKRGHADIFGV